MPELIKKWIGCAEGNFATGRLGYKPEGIVVHLMAGTLLGTDCWFLSTPEERNEPPSSAHYGIGKSGEIHQYVKETDRADHAGKVKPKPSTLPLLLQFPGNPNLFTIGIEHEGQLEDEWPEPMIEASAALIAEICGRWDIPIDRTHIVGHHEIFCDKPCPGPKCPLELIIELAQKPVVPLAT